MQSKSGRAEYELSRRNYSYRRSIAWFRIKLYQRASKDGYATGFTTIDYHVSNWYWFGNILFGGLIGWFIVDPITGDMYYLDEVATVNLTPLPKE